MSHPISARSKITAFAIGAVFGSAVYALYLWLGKDDDCYTWFASGGIFVGTFGSIFFPVQYLIYSFGDYWPFSDAAIVAICFCLVALLYGYIFLSLRLFPRLAIGTFVSSIMAILFLMITFMNSTNPIFGILFWQVSKLEDFVEAANLPHGPITLASFCIILGLWYAAFICGLATLVRYPKVKVAASKNPGNSSSIFGCPKCGQQLRTPVTGPAVMLRCPSCKATFQSNPQT